MIYTLLLIIIIIVYILIMWPMLTADSSPSHIFLFPLLKCICIDLCPHKDGSVCACGFFFAVRPLPKA